jgi:hypothetical protein
LSFPSYPTIYLFACSSASHFLVVCSPSECCFSPKTINVYSIVVLSTPFYSTPFYSTPVTQPHFTQPPVTQPHFTQSHVTQPVLCELHPSTRHHPCYPPTMSHSKPLSPLTPFITPTLHDHPRTNLVPWKIAAGSLNRMSSTIPLGNS